MPVTARAIVAVAAPERGSPMLQELARDVGRAIISRGHHVLMSGGGAILQACCEGAQEEKTSMRRRGKFVGDAPSVLLMVPGNGKPEGFDEADMVLPTGLGAAVQTVVCASADALIALDGGASVLAQVALGWALRKPLVLMSPTGTALEHLAGERLDSSRADMILTADTADRAVELLGDLGNRAGTPSKPARK
ncbi:MAG: hypothetical protein HY904_19425 [Deltaproteobacteria bacterium]|nr:hypothetical protein [Deltaproteobacteria bacterium]